VEWLDGASAQQLVGQYGYGAIFVIVMLESAGIPMPEETILVSAAVYAGTRHALDIRWIIAAAAGGAILGDNVGFWVGREFGEPLLEKWAHFIGLDARKRLLARYLFARYGGLIVFRRAAARLRRVARRREWLGTVAVLRLQRSRRNCLGDDIRVGPLPARRGHPPHRRTGRLGAAASGTRRRVGLWRYDKKHEENLLAKAEDEMARQDR
jgi:membrane protein YqaA with SNARE-associated domain